ncbi:MAG: type II toxin-antitoxin system VapB family antitoxin [Dehalococcoidia bacterium]|nr:type II toxin-antitoxin system VapB family antitoxin [Dehalococcoidia bacterium]
MLTTLDIDRKLLDAVVEATGEKTESGAVNEVLREYLSWKNVQDIRSMAGRSKIEDTTARQRKLDKKRHKFLERLRHG